MAEALDADVADFIETEVRFQVRQEIRRRRAYQSGILAIALLFAATGLVLAGLSYQQLQRTRDRNEQLVKSIEREKTLIQALGAARPEEETHER